MLPQKRTRQRTIGWLQKNARCIWIFQRVIDAILTIAVLWGLSSIFHIEFSTPYIVLAAITVLVTWPVFKTIGLYYSYRSEHPAATYPRVWGGWAVVMALLLLIGYITNTFESFFRPLLCTWFVLTPFVLCLHHLVLRFFLRWLRATGLNSRKAVIAGTGELSQALAQHIQQSPQLGLQFHGFFTDRPLRARSEILIKPMIGTLEDLPDYVRRHRIDVVYVALALQNDASVSKLINALQDTTVCVYFVPNITAFSLMQARVYDMKGIPLIAVWEAPLTTAQVMVKRMTDIVVSSVALAVVSPLMIGIAIAVTLISSGPVLQKERRYGFNGCEVVVYKFQAPYIKHDRSKDLGLLTLMGRFLRKTGLTSLPQLINVLQGRLSLVGPRPQLVAHAELYRKYMGKYCLGLEVIKPGLTGLAELHGLCEESENQEILQARVAYDLDYLKNWSFGLDLKIMAKTTFDLLQRQNAY
jgi:putative colanic acid biosysnthesis UDP-glucose lipid carrier transferase